MPPLVKKNAGETGQKRMAGKLASKSPNTSVKRVSSTPSKAKPEAKKKAELKSSPTEEKTVEAFQDLKEDLKKVFSEVGEVVEIRLARNSQTQKNRGFGFVRFASVEQAKKAVAELKYPEVRGKQCGVTRNQDNETLHVRNICKSWTKEALIKKLIEYGVENIEEITLMEDPEEEGANKGFALVEFPTHLEATNALKRLQKRDVFFGTQLCAKVAFAKSGIQPDEEVMAQVRSIFVDGIPPSWDEERVEEKFTIYGEIEQVELARNMPTAKRKDFGFISFTTREAALACIEGVNKEEVNEEDNKVTLKATLRKPQQKGRGVKDGVRAGKRAPWVRGVSDIERRRMGAGDRVHERRQPAFGRAPVGRDDRQATSVTGRSSYRDDRRTTYVGRDDRRATSVTGRSSYQPDDYGRYSDQSRPRYPQYTAYTHRMNGMPAYNYTGVSGSKRPYSDVGDDLDPYPGRYSRSRLEYDVGAAYSLYAGVASLGQHPQQRDGGSDCPPSRNDIGSGLYPSAITRNPTSGYGGGSASYY